MDKGDVTDIDLLLSKVDFFSEDVLLKERIKKRIIKTVWEADDTELSPTELKTLSAAGYAEPNVEKNLTPRDLLNS